ncbi:hypothetical protein GALL_548840 [mine drainage metagenome]|uniref:Uncharacterized protein n=1 Tax=mine drainage metagenome TaxID=410659 RepID=A0A1J5P705_9ZZZZ
MGNDFGVGLALKNIPFGLQGSTQFVVIFNDAVVHQCNAPGAAGGLRAGTMTEVWVGVVHGRGTVGRPAGVGDAGAALKLRAVDLGL